MLILNYELIKIKKKQKQTKNIYVLPLFSSGGSGCKNKGSGVSGGGPSKIDLLRSSSEELDELLDELSLRSRLLAKVGISSRVPLDVGLICFRCLYSDIDN